MREQYIVPCGDKVKPGDWALVDVEHWREKLGAGSVPVYITVIGTVICVNKDKTQARVQVTRP